MIKNFFLNKFLFPQTEPENGFSITRFMSHYAAYSETARADKFDVMIALPNALVGSYGARELSLQCESAEFPGIDVVPIEYRHYGFIQRIPHHLTYTPLSLTFYCTGEMMEKKLFDSWMNEMIPNDTGLVEYRFNNQGISNYEATIYVNQYDQFGRVTYYAQALEAMPISVGQINTNWSDDSTHRLTVTFAYTKWITDADKDVATLKPRPQNVSNFLQDINKVINTGIDINNQGKAIINTINNKVGGVLAAKNVLGNIKSQLPTKKSIIKF